MVWLAWCRFVRFTRNREQGILNQLSSPPSKHLASFASDSIGPNSTIQGHSAAFSLNIALYLNVISKHCLVCGQTHNKWWPAMSNFPGSMVIKLACDAEQIQRRKALLASSAHIFWSRPEVISAGHLLFFAIVWGKQDTSLCMHHYEHSL